MPGMKITGRPLPLTFTAKSGWTLGCPQAATMLDNATAVSIESAARGQRGEKRKRRINLVVAAM